MRLRKEVVVTFIVLALLVVGGLFFVYYIKDNLTGYFVYGSSNESDFDLGEYFNVYFNGSSVVLSGENLSGVYTSVVIDSGKNSYWNNLSHSYNEPSLGFLFAVDGAADVWKSSDDGLTWNLVKDDYNGGEINSATDMIKNSSGSLFILHNQDLWVSNDLGVTWNLINDDFNSGGDSNNGIVMGIDSNDFIYIFDGSEDVYVSSDSGASFSIVGVNLNEGNGNVLGFSVNSSNSLFVVDAQSDVWESKDNGLTWNLVKDDYNGGLGNGANDMVSDSEGNLYILHNQDFWKSSDNGLSWTLINDDFNSGLDSNSGLVVVVDDNNYFYIADGSEDIYGSTDGGINFSYYVANFNEGNGNIFGMAFVLADSFLSVEVRNCSDSNCSDGAWQVVDFDNLNLASRYFQYRVNFESPDSLISPSLDSVLIDYDWINDAPIVSIILPENTLYLINESLELNFSVSDSDLNLDSCWYNIDGVVNITINCSENLFFDTSTGVHELILYANDSYGELTSDSVIFNVDSDGVSVSINEPTGTKTSREAIALEFDVIGNDLYCFYNVKTSIGGGVIENTTIENCSATSFDVSTDGNYVVNLYLNNSLGSSDFDSSNFSVDTSDGGTVIVNEGGSGGGGGGGGGPSVIVKNSYSEVLIEELPVVTTKPKDSKELTLSIENTGTTFLNDCELVFEKDYFSSIEKKNLAAGEETEFSFELKVPEKISSGVYGSTVVFNCEGFNSSTNVSFEVLEQRLKFELIDSKRIDDENVQVVYMLEELSGSDQVVELQFLLMDLESNMQSEVTEIKNLGGGEKNNFEILLPIEPYLEGELKLLVNLNSESYSTFVEEIVILGSPLSGLAVFGDESKRDNILSLIFLILFVVFAGFMVFRILSHRKILKKKIKK